MAKRKESDTLAQQRKAREDFLALKKMQKGEMESGPKPSEVAIVPKTFKEKLQNYWFHFKWHTIVSVASAIVLTILVAQCAARETYDMKIIYFSYIPVMDDRMHPIEEYFENISQDLDGDGEVNIQVINCSASPENGEYYKTVMSKLQAIIRTESQAVLYITDSQTQEYLENAYGKGEFFATKPTNLPVNFYDETVDDTFGSLPSGLQIARRKVKGTLLEKEKYAEEVEKESKEILKKLAEK